MSKEKIDFVGKKGRYYEVIRKGNGRTTSGGQKKTTWVCKCCCGNEFEVDHQKLYDNRVGSCGCMRKKLQSQSKMKDISGNKYGRLTVIRFLDFDEREAIDRQWLCQCDCGNFITTNSSKLKSGHTRSCGCFVKEHIGNVNRKFKHTDKKLYAVYKAMIHRCYNNDDKKYYNYGGRGIRVCDEWKESFDIFYEWAKSNGHEEGLTLDRIDVNGNYEPSNCRWITNDEQQNNKRTNITVSYKGVTKTIKQWADYFNIPYNYAYWRLVKKRMTIQDFMKEIRIE